MRTVVIGASSGLGRCVAVALAQQGEPVAMLARRKDRLDEAAAEGGPTAFPIECDVTDHAGQLVARASSTCMKLRQERPATA